jgi:hypothetical protein
MLIGIAKALGGILLTGIGVVAAAMGAGVTGRRDCRDVERRFGELVRQLLDSPQGELRRDGKGRDSSTSSALP